MEGTQVTSHLHTEVQMTRPYLCSARTPNQGYQWLKDKILSEEGRRQQAKLKELQAIAERLGCTLPQLAIGNGLGEGSLVPGPPLHQPAVGHGVPHPGERMGVPEHLGHLSTRGQSVPGPPATPTEHR